MLRVAVKQTDMCSFILQYTEYIDALKDFKCTVNTV